MAAIQDGEPFAQSLIRNLHRTLLEGVVSSLREQYGVTYPTARADANKLVSAGILEELPGSSPKAFYLPEIVEITFE